MNAANSTRGKDLSGQARSVDGLLTRAEWRKVARSLDLSPREVEVVKGVIGDLSETSIASELQISQHTVHTYVERVYRKLNVNSRVALVVRIFSEHLALQSLSPD